MFFYQFAVHESRAEKQIIGPRVPRSWFSCLDNMDLYLIDEFETWYTNDLYSPAAGPSHSVDNDMFCQLSARAVLMGDKSAVTVIQEAHTRIL